MSDDAALLVAIGEGSERAFNELVDRHQRSVRVFLRGLVARADADDVAQEVFLAVWTGAATYKRGASVRSWLLAIAWRKAKDHHRRFFRARRRETAYGGTESGAEAGASEEEQVLARQALMSLSLGERAAVLLCLAAGFSHTEAADALAMPLGTVKSHVARGRERMREILERER
jgi:RNA polymerase sigma-70 factor (ECF subfamily)